MFSRQHRKARVLFGLSDILLTALAFEAAYQTRILLHLDRVFFLDVPKNDRRGSASASAASSPTAPLRKATFGWAARPALTSR